MEDIIPVVVKAFGPAGAFAILLLAASVYANWKLVNRLLQAHQTAANLDKAHISDMAACRLSCEQDKVIFKAELERRYQEQVKAFVDATERTRENINTMFNRFENLVGVVSDGMTKMTEATSNLRYNLKGNR